MLVLGPALELPEVLTAPDPDEVPVALYCLPDVLLVLEVDAETGVVLAL